MSITSFSFVLFIAALIAVYYAVPKRFQWLVLLAASCIFYLSCGAKNALFVLVTAASIYFAARRLDKLEAQRKQTLAENKATWSKEEKAAFKNQIKARRKAVLILCLVLNFGLMCFFKYFHFALEQLNAIIGVFGGDLIVDNFSFIIPLGISFYTFQATGYLINVYWGNAKAEQNFLKLLLFVSFFPQVTQGPISEYEQLAPQFFAEHRFSAENYIQGFQRMLWGFMKKMVLANMLAPYVQDVFVNYPEYSGITCLIGAFAYSVQIYADFSGYMDIMCGLCQMLDIKLTENFLRPYFSKSIAEYWRRWHISLGAWFKSYIYYPIAVSKWNMKLGQKVQKRFGKAVAKNLPASIALVAVWFTTGFWHGASWAYIAWGGVNGLFIIFSMWMEPVYERCKSTLRINESAWLWRAFQVIRTFILVTFIKVLPELGTLSAGFGLWMQIFTEHSIPTSFNALLPFVSSKLDLLVILGLTALLFVTSLMQRKKPIRHYFNRMPMPLRSVVLSLILMAILVFGVPATSSYGGFMYAQF